MPHTGSKSSLLLPASAAGLGFRRELAADLLANPDAADFLEVMAESALASGGALKEAQAVSRMWPVVLHGVKLSLGSAAGLDETRAARFGSLARTLGARFVGEHISFTRAGPPSQGVEIGHLTPLPRTMTSVEVMRRNVTTLKKHLDVPLLLENTAWTFSWPGPQMLEETFIHHVVQATGCQLLLDLGNLRANARNDGRDPFTVLEAFPLHAVGMLHMAGSITEDGFLMDTHAHPVEEETVELLRHLVRRIGPRPVLLERDHDFPSFGTLAKELELLRGINAAASPQETPGHHEPEPHSAAVDVDALARLQLEVAHALTSVDVPAGHAGLDPNELARARNVLKRKRLDEALPLLPCLSAAAQLPLVQSTAAAVLGMKPRTPHGVGLADAFSIAAACLLEPALADLANRDLLLLRARFSGPAKDGTYGARSLPFVGRTTLGNGRVVWMLKGVGAAGNVRLVEG